jgi:CRP-like cAMP-binding protein
MLWLRHHLGGSGVPFDAITALARSAEARHVAAGQTVAIRGQPAKEVSIVVEGELEIRDADGQRRVLRRGSSFGFLEMLGGADYPGSITSQTKSRLLAYSASTLFDVMEDHPPIGLAIVANLASTLLNEKSSARR